MAWELAGLNLPERPLQLDHRCRVRHCVNPEHLRIVTGAENVRHARAQITHCPHGHAYDQTNTLTHGGRRHCRACRKRRFDNWAAKHPGYWK